MVSCFSRWWFHISFVIFTPKIRDMIQFDEYFFCDGLKPPTRKCSIETGMNMFHSWVLLFFEKDRETNSAVKQIGLV